MDDNYDTVLLPWPAKYDPAGQRLQLTHPAETEQQPLITQCPPQPSSHGEDLVEYGTTPHLRNTFGQRASPKCIFHIVETPYPATSSRIQQDKGCTADLLQCKKQAFDVHNGDLEHGETHGYHAMIKTLEIGRDENK